jgi:hypothetical protein
MKMTLLCCCVSLDLVVIEEMITEARENQFTDCALFRTLESAVKLSYTCNEIVSRLSVKCTAKK